MGRMVDWSHLPPDAISHAAHFLTSTADRLAARSTCTSWRAALDQHWSRGCFLARLPDNPTDKASRLLASFAARRQPLWPRLRELDVAEVNAQRLAALLPSLTPDNFPALARLGLSAVLHEPCGDGGQLARLQLGTRLRELRLADVVPKKGLASLTHQQSLTALHVCATYHGGAAVSSAWESVRSLTGLAQLQALSLPALGQDSRQALGLLTQLTYLSFGAAGAGAVGANLLPLRRTLRALRVALHHKHEAFLVLHPAVEWGALAQLQALTSLQVLNWAAGRRNAAPLLSAPMFIWADQGAVEEHAGVLLAGLTQLCSLGITAAYCRLEHGSAGTAEAAAAGGWEGQALPAGGGVEKEDGEVIADGRGRLWLRQERRVPVERAGSKREEAWYHAWWQDDVQSAVQALFGPEDTSLHRYRQDAHNVPGWVAIRPDLPATFDLELEFSLIQQQ